MSNYVIFQETAEWLLDGTIREGLMFIALSDAGAHETALRSRATQFIDARAAYRAAGRYPQLADWRVGAR